MNLKDLLKCISKEISPQNNRRISTTITRITSSPCPIEEMGIILSSFNSANEAILSSSSHAGQIIADLVALMTKETGLATELKFSLPKMIERNHLKRYGKEPEPTLILWLTNTVITKASKQKLHNIVDQVEIFDNVDECIDNLISMNNQKVFLIVSCLHMNIIPSIWQIPQLLCIYVLCKDAIKHDGNYQNVYTIYYDENDLMKQLDDDIKLHSNVDNTLPMRILSKSSNEKSCRDLNSDEYVSFIWFQLLIEILILMPDTEDAKNSMINECLLCYKNNNNELNKINCFKETYCSEKTIDWYTKDSFVYRLLNTALRTENIDIIFKFRYFIKNLHNNLISLQKYSTQMLSSPKFTVFRGQHLSNSELKMLLSNIGGLISMNSFLSTTLNRNLALTFAGDGSRSPLLESVLFQLECNTITNRKPFASTNTSESEILFSIGAIFRIENIGKLKDNNNIWFINLMSVDDNENETHMKELTDHLMENISPNPTVESIAAILSTMGECQKAQKYYEMALKNIPSNDVSNIARITTCIGDCEKDSNLALKAYTDALQLEQQSSNQSSIAIAHLYERIGVTNFKLFNYEDALGFHKKALEIYHNESLSPEESCFALAYYNIGRVYNKLDDKQSALDNLEKSIEIFSKSSLLVEPNLALIYNELSSVHLSLKNYDISLVYLEIALDINMKSPYLTKKLSIARNYFDIGLVLYEKRTADEKSLETLQKAAESYGKILPIDRETLAQIHDNMAMIYCRQREWIRAIQAYAKSCEYRFGHKRKNDFYIVNSTCLN
ncbi:unnamed protein product [Rotaria socialis]|uniref:NAD(P)(+)--arginine ADP-ribosyltransferase n=1 Tax=Rotaria socialis TaxID=392032 RepID=A0A817Z6U7_9BILA|nr:unnamed protein product [Rotaria socialis]CAF3471656.1 unnamed protein product [Rotaria socialis]CAF3590785.1 unnamed protein product [Rotaria socialis]CAF3687523.1 unnamed protein product [Rotaria socialis]CAF4189995.1 unnamed protein product [Rotaria socialis]